MINNISGYSSTYNSPQVDKSYINKFDKSLKLPFYKVLSSNLPGMKPAGDDEIKINDSEIAASDNIAINSAVVGAAAVSDTDTGSATYA